MFASDSPPPHCQRARADSACLSTSPTPARGPSPRRCARQGAYLTLALHALVEDIKLPSLASRRPLSLLPGRKLLAEVDTLARGGVPSPRDCHCGSLSCPGCDAGRAFASGTAGGGHAPVICLRVDVVEKPPPLRSTLMPDCCSSVRTRHARGGAYPLRPSLIRLGRVSGELAGSWAKR